MKLKLIIIGWLGTVANSFAQLPPEFAGTYLSDDFSTVFSLEQDKSGDSDFIFNLEFNSENGTMSFSGNGRVLNNEGIEISIEKNRYRGFIELDDFGFLNLYLDFPNEKGRMHLIHSSNNENYNESTFLDAQIFLNEKGAELDIFDNHGVIGFRIISSNDDPCGVSEISGFMTPVDGDLSVLNFNTEDGCSIEFLSSEKGIFINQSACVEPNCEDFSGMFFHVEDQ